MNPLHGLQPYHGKWACVGKILEKDKKGPVTVTIDDNKITLNKPWQPIDCLSNNPEAHDWRITEDERSN